MSSLIDAVIVLAVGAGCFLCGWKARMAYMERQFRSNPWFIKKIIECKIAELEREQQPKG